MRRLIGLLAIIAVVLGAQAEKQVFGKDVVVAQIFDSCDLMQNQYLLYAGIVDNLDNFPYEIKAILFSKQGKLTFYEDDNAEGRQFVVDHDLECIEEGSVSWEDPQAQFFILHNQKLSQQNKNLRQSKIQQTMA